MPSSRSLALGRDSVVTFLSRFWIRPSVPDLPSSTASDALTLGTAQSFQIAEPDGPVLLAKPERKKPSSRYLEISLAVLGIAASVAGSVVTIESTQQWMVFFFFCSLVSTLICLFVIITQNSVIYHAYENTFSLDGRIYDLQTTRDFLQIQLAETRRSLDRISQEVADTRHNRDLALTAAVTGVHNAYAHTARRFHTLTLIISEFERSVFHYLGTLAAGRIDIKKAIEQRHEIEMLFKNALREICNTASYAIPRRKSDTLDPGVCSTNIKVLTGDGNSPRYFPFIRSQEGAGFPERDKRDKLVRQNPIQVSDNKVYVYLLNKDTPDYYVCKNMTDLLAEIKSDRRSGFVYSQPEEDDMGYFMSFLVVPITGAPSSTAVNLPNDRTYTELRQERVLGFFSIDSRTPDFFDVGYDLDITKELASMVFDCFRAFDTVHVITSQMGIDRYSDGTLWTRMSRKPLPQDV
jgi:hypothetical protein